MTESFYKSSLYDVHVQLGAKIVPFGGWEMPLQYKSVIAEHKAVRESVGIFDVSHLGKLAFGGDPAVLDSALPRKVSTLEVGQASYNLVLTEDGGIVDDIFVYRRLDDFMIVPNASNTDAVLHILQLHTGEIRDIRHDFAVLALSGPHARGIVTQIAPVAGDLKLHRFVQTDVAGIPAIVAKTGYTGEYTAEFFVPSDRAAELWSILVEQHRVEPSGLGARDTLRLEMGYPLHGSDISVTTNPLEAQLGWVIDWDNDFLGKAALERVMDSGISRKLVGLRAKGREIPRHGYPIRNNGEVVGEVTSGNFSPTLGAGIALGYVPTDLSDAGTMLAVDVRGKSLEVEVTKPPFIKS